VVLSINWDSSLTGIGSQVSQGNDKDELVFVRIVVGRKERESLGRKKDQKACRAFPGDDLRSRAATQLLH
jgi:hypothetical protein